MKIFSYVSFIALLFASLTNAEEKQDRSCIRQNVTYVLCTVSSQNVTVVSETFTAESLGTECHEHFVEGALGKSVCGEHEYTEEKEGPTTTQRWGFGFLAVFVVSVMSFAGLLAFPLMYKMAFQYVIATFTALAVGTLFGDAMFHLIPFALGLHSHDEDEHGHGQEENHSSEIVPVYQWKMFTAVMILYAFYLLEVFLHWFGHARANKNAVHSHSHGHRHSFDGIRPAVTQSPKENSDSNTSPSNNNIPSTGARVTGWMVIIGDGIHNFADGLAIGAAFSEDLTLGLTTTIAIGCHELPHEFGDYAVLIQSGFSHCQALFWNFLSATTAFIGFVVGAAVSTNESARQWIFAVTIGMFLYIALADLLPTLLPEGRLDIKRFICVNIGFLLGIAIMFILAIFEHRLLDVGN